MTALPKENQAVVDLTVCPQPLITCGENGCDIIIEESTWKALEKRRKPAVVVAVVGLYRTGKSYLMNRLSPDKTDRSSRFILGNTIQSKTKGIWIWVRPHPTKEGKDLILLDTEGLGDVLKVSKEHDNWIYCLAILLSSALIHNCVGAFNEQNVDDIHFVTQMASHLKTKNTRPLGQDFDFDAYFPSLIIALRDFNLELEIDGEKVSANEYLEHCLQLKEGIHEGLEKYNKSRHCIRKYFLDRTCFTFESPGNKKVLQNLEQATDDERVDDEFKKEVQRFKESVFRKAQVKQINQTIAVTGRMLANMLRCFVDSIQSDQVPCIEDAVKTMSKIENSKAVSGALDVFKEELGQVVIPTKTIKDAMDIRLEATKKALVHFFMGVVLDKEHKFQEELQDKIEAHYKEFKAKNEEASKTKCEKALQDLYQPIKDKFTNGNYSGPEASSKHQKDLNDLQADYEKREDLGVMKIDVLVKFLREKATAFKETENAVQEELTKRETVLQNEITDLKRDAAKQCVKMHLEHIHEAQKKEISLFSPGYQEILKQRKEEKKRLEEEGLHKEAEEKEEEIEVLNEEYETEVKEIETGKKATRRYIMITTEEKVIEIEYPDESYPSKLWKKFKGWWQK